MLEFRDVIGYASAWMTMQQYDYFAFRSGHARVVSPRIDEMRGLAALLVVIFHAIGADPILAASLLGQLTQASSFVRMPLFIAISGYLYGQQRERRPLNFHGLSRRAKRVLPPFLLVTIVCYVISAAGGSGFDMTDGLLFGAWHLWYIQALLIILLVVTIIETAAQPAARHLPIWAMAIYLVIATGLFDSFRLFSAYKAAYLLPHFLAGAAFGAMPQLLANSRLRVFIGMLGLIALGCNIVSMAGVGPVWTRTSLVADMIGIASFVLLATVLPTNTTLERLGAYSLPIFLWHLPLSAVFSFLIFNRLGVEGQSSIVLKVAVGTMVPIVMSMMTTRFAPALVIFIGQRSVGPRPVTERRQFERRVTGHGMGAGRSGRDRRQLS